MELEARARGCQGCRTRPERRAPWPRPARGGAATVAPPFVGLAVVNGARGATYEPSDERALLAADEGAMPRRRWRNSDDLRGVRLGPLVDVGARAGGGAIAIDDALAHGSGRGRDGHCARTGPAKAWAGGTAARARGEGQGPRDRDKSREREWPARRRGWAARSSRNNEPPPRGRPEPALRADGSVAWNHALLLLQITKARARAGPPLVRRPAAKAVPASGHHRDGGGQRDSKVSDIRSRRRRRAKARGRDGPIARRHRFVLGAQVKVRSSWPPSRRTGRRRWRRGLQRSGLRARNQEAQHAARPAVEGEEHAFDSACGRQPLGRERGAG